MRRLLSWVLPCVWWGVVLGAGGWNAQAQTPTLEDRVRQLEEAYRPDDRTIQVFWRDGLRLQTLDRAVEIRLGGRLNIDWNVYFPDEEMAEAFGDAEDRIFVRRGRLDLRGTMYKYFVFRLEVDFAGDDVAFTDAYVGLQNLPVVGSLLVGRFKVPFGLEELTSDSFITFQERALALEAFAPSREWGVRLHNTVLHERMTWALSLTRTGEGTASTSFVKGAGDDWTAAARLTGVPWYANKGQHLVHLGVAYAYKSFLKDEGRYRTRPEARLEFDQNGDGAADSLRFVDTGAFRAALAHQIGAEAALVVGPFSLQGEYMMAFGLDPEGRPTPRVENAIDEATFHGFYVMASYFLTGEHRPYNTSDGIFERLRPKKNFLLGGVGAWEVGLRFSSIDLDDARAMNGREAGGKETNVTFGVNWYPNPNFRVTANYVHGWVDRLVDGVAGTPLKLDDSAFGVFMMRFQVDL
jgi:phosphate-selective porin OprO and OprP